MVNAFRYGILGASRTFALGVAISFMAVAAVLLYLFCVRLLKEWARHAPVIAWHRAALKKTPRGFTLRGVFRFRFPAMQHPAEHSPLGKSSAYVATYSPEAAVSYPARAEMGRAGPERSDAAVSRRGYLELLTQPSWLLVRRWQAGGGHRTGSPSRLIRRTSSSRSRSSSTWNSAPPVGLRLAAGAIGGHAARSFRRGGPRRSRFACAASMR
ncbi:hypothetical protein SSTU70S_05414 [Stutzerimonas stutzeri]